MKKQKTETSKLYRYFFLKNFLHLLMPMLIPLILMAGISIFFIQKIAHDKVLNDNKTLLLQTKDKVDLIFDEFNSLNLYVVASATEFVNLQRLSGKDLLDQEDQKELAKLKNFIDSPNISKPFIHSIYIYVDNNQGRFISSGTGGLLDIAEFDDTGWYDSFKKHAMHDMEWAEARTIPYSKFNKEAIHIPVITLYQRIPGYDGVLVLNVATNYFDKRLKVLAGDNRQRIIIMDERDTVIFHSQDLLVDETDVQRLAAEPSNFYKDTLSGTSYTISKLVSKDSGWTYSSLTPETSIWEIPKAVSKAAVLFLLVFIAASLGIAFFLTKRNARVIQSILSIFQAAEKGSPLPQAPDRIHDVYSYITFQILRNFVEQDVLKARLIEQQFKEQTLEYAALHAQLNPHFLYNTLETLNWKAIGLTGKPTELNTMIENLADILRYSLSGPEELMTLQDEIMYTNSYIQIQKTRYREEFEVSWHYPDSCRNFSIKKLIFQPLIENAIMHGITYESVCRIKIVIRPLADHLDISVIDNGNGMTKDRLQFVRKRLELQNNPTAHIGLLNTHRRLKVAYGDEFGGLKILSKKGFGTVIQFKIPIENKDTQVEPTHDN